MQSIDLISDIKKLSSNCISIWGVQVSKNEANVKSLFNILSSNEQLKASKFKNKNQAQASVLARGALRVLLGAYENCSPKDINFSRTNDGKPFLKNSNTSFNISHSSDWVILAFCKNYSIGVDLEELRDVNFLNISKRFFNKEEQIFLKNSSNPKRTFFDLWSRKEAIIKANGNRLLSEISNTNIPIIENEIPEKFVVDKWFVYKVEAGSNYSAALAIDAEVNDHPCYDFGSLKWQS
tara:strand:+ start:266 stop:976 length:711 start_codon:yes stop_codon:yes gene_type:complete